MQRLSGTLFLFAPFGFAGSGAFIAADDRMWATGHHFCCHVFKAQIQAIVRSAVKIYSIVSETVIALQMFLFLKCGKVTFHQK